jgi:hypothetical protein
VAENRASKTDIDEVSCQRPDLPTHVGMQLATENRTARIYLSFVIDFLKI